jgi:phage shock protein A
VAKNSIFQRVATYLKSEYHYFLDSFKSDEQILENQFNAFIRNAETVQSSITDSILGMRDMEGVRNADEDKLMRLNVTIENLSTQAKASAAGIDAETKSLMRNAVTQQVALETKIRKTDEVLAQQRASVENLKKELSRLEEKKNELILKKDSLQSRSKSADAMLRIQKTLSSTNLDGLSTNLNSLEMNVRRQESIVSGYKEINESSPEHMFDVLTKLEEEDAIESRLNALTTKSIESGTGSNVISLSDHKRTTVTA